MEKWKTIKSFENYEVSDHGNVRNTNTGEQLKTPLNSWGYPSVTLCDENGRKNKTVHRLVAEAFIPKIHKLLEVNHKDEDKTNNHVSNLEWVTKKENMNHGTRTKRASESRYKKVCQYNLQGKLLMVWNSMKDAEKAGFSHTGVSQCCHGKRTHYKGYVWGWFA